MRKIKKKIIISHDELNSRSSVIKLGCISVVINVLEYDCLPSSLT